MSKSPRPSPASDVPRQPDAAARPSRLAHGSAADSARSTAGRGRLFATMCVGLFLVLLDVTVVMVALPDISRHLGAGLAGAQWVSAAYQISLASLLLTGGVLGDRYGHRGVVLTGLTLLPGTLAVVTRAFPDRAEQARAIGLWAAVAGLALPAGPLVGGLLVSAVGWRAVFAVNVPIVLAAVVAVRRQLPAARGGRDARDRPLDRAGVVLAAAALAAFVLAGISSRTAGVLSPLVLGTCVAGALLAAGFVVAERRAAAPMLPPWLARDPAFAASALVAGGMNFVGNGFMVVLTLALQNGWGYSALAAGLASLPMFVPLVALPPLVGRVNARLGPRTPMTVGLITGAVGLLLVALTASAGAFAPMLPGLLLFGVGLACSPPPWSRRRWRPRPAGSPGWPAVPTTPRVRPVAPWASLCWRPSPATLWRAARPGRCGPQRWQAPASTRSSRSSPCWRQRDVQPTLSPCVGASIARLGVVTDHLGQ